MKQVDYTSTNGRWGISMIVPDDFEGWPVKANLEFLGTIEGHRTYNVVLSDTGSWIYVGALCQPVAGCTVIHSMGLQSHRDVTVIAGGDFFAFKEFGYKGRSCSVISFRDGKRVTLPAGVMAAMGLLPYEKTVVDIQIPELESPLATALKKAGF